MGMKQEKRECKLCKKLFLEEELSEEDMQREVDKFFAQESVRRANWKRIHKQQENV